MEPITAGLVLQLATGIFGNLFGHPGTPAGPTQAQVAALLAQQKAAADADRNAWMLGLGIAAVGAVGLAIMLARK